MLAIGAVLLHGVPACMSTGDDKLNPQPLPPGDPPPERGEDTSGESNSGGAAPLPGSFADGGVAADADADTEGGRDE